MDIKKRLPHEVCYDAADEILRQRAEIERLKHQLAIAEANGARAQSYFETCERLRATLQDMIEISQRNSEAALMLLAIRRCAENALGKTRPSRELKR